MKWTWSKACVDSEFDTVEKGGPYGPPFSWYQVAAILYNQTAFRLALMIPNIERTTNLFRTS
jgi:hypothetical protein